MKQIFSKIESLKSELNRLENQKEEVIEFIKEKIYKNSLYSNFDKTISNKQKAKACIYLYNNTTFEGWASGYEYPELSRNWWSKENKQPEYFDYFVTSKFNVREDYNGNLNPNYIFELQFSKQIFNPQNIGKETWQNLVVDGKTMNGYKEFIEEMKIKDNLEYLELIEKYCDYKLIKIDCPELELENWFYAIHKNNVK
jgi:hypothetical protein